MGDSFPVLRRFYFRVASGLRIIRAVLTAARPVLVPNEAFQFGTFELDRCSGELRKHGVKIKLQEQPFQVLLLLLDQPGRVTSREEIRERLWPENTFVDFDNAINSAVRKLREALGDHSENPRFIETVAKRGYRFIAPVTTAAPPQEAPVLPIAPPSLSPPARHRTRRAWVGLFALAVAVAGVVSLVMTWRGSNAEPDFVTTPLTSYPGSERSPSFSPDGSRIAFSWDHADTQGAAIYVKMLDSGNPVRLTNGPHFDYSPAWSPDGKRIAFLRYWRDLEAVMLMSAMGGQEKELFRGKNRLGSFGSDQIPVHPYLTWSADNRYLFTVGPNSANPDGFAIFRLAETGEWRQVTFPSPGRGGDGGAAVSGDGKHLAFVRTTSRATLDLYTVMLGKDSLPAGQPKRILSDVWIEGLAWTADSREIVFAGSVHGKESFWRIRGDGERTVQPISGISLNAAPSKLKSSYFDRGTDVAISPQGQYLVYSQTNTDMNIWRVGLRGREKGKPAPLIHSTRDESMPVYSADGRKIAFESEQSGTEEIWVANADGSDATQLTTFNSGWSGSPNFSPDGRSIAFDRQEVLTWNIYVMTAQGGNPVRITGSGADDFRASWSSDGRWIFFTSERTGRDEIWKVPAAGGKAMQITKTGGGYQREAAEGGAIYYIKEANPVSSLWKCAEDGTQNHKVLDSIHQYSPAKSGIYFLPGKWSPALPLRFFDFHTQQTTTLLFLDGTRIDLRMSVSPDERWMLFGQQDGTLGDLMLVKNFR